MKLIPWEFIETLSIPILYSMDPPLWCKEKEMGHLFLKPLWILKNSMNLPFTKGKSKESVYKISSHKKIHQLISYLIKHIGYIPFYYDIVFFVFHVGIYFLWIKIICSIIHLVCMNCPWLPMTILGIIANIR